MEPPIFSIATSASILAPKATSTIWSTPMGARALIRLTSPWSLRTTSWAPAVLAAGSSASSHQHCASSDVAPNMDCAVSRDAGYSKASAFLGRHVLSEGCDMIERNNGELRGRPERAVRLRTVAPHLPTNPFGRYALADLIHPSGPVAVRDNT